MASLTADPKLEALKKLQLRGVEMEDFVAIGKDDALADEVYAAILRHRLFAKPEAVIATVLEINEAVWKDTAVTEAAIRALGDPPEVPLADERGLSCLGLFRETGDAVHTFAENWAAAQFVHTLAGTWKWDGLLFTPSGVRQRVGAKPRPLGLRWQVAELGRGFQNRKVKDVRPALDSTAVMGMGQELPLLAALHPKWVKSMNGADRPFVDAPDLEVDPSGQGGFSSAPCLFFYRVDGQVGLRAYDVSVAGPSYGSGSLR